MTVYADFTYYQNTYLGTVIVETAFPQLALRASAVIDRITFNRAKDETIVANINSIKMAMCAVAEELKNQDASGGTDGITSEAVGSHSVSYSANSQRGKTNQDKLELAARLWLDGTYLMFGGFNSGEYGATLDTP